MDNSITFITYERNREKKKFWYAEFKDSDGNKFSTVSLRNLAKKMKLDEKVKNKKAAERLCTLAIERGFIKSVAGGGSLLSDYILDYWDFNSARIRRMNRRRKNSVSENYAGIMLGNIKNHIIPRLPNSLTIEEVTPKFVKRIADDLLDEDNMSNATIEKIMGAFSKPLRDAHNEGLIRVDPTRLLESLDDSPKKQRGILTRSELQKVLALMKEEASDHVYFSVLLAAATGIRLGELRNLYSSDINIVNDQDAIINIGKSWSVKGGEKITKGKKVRFAPCPTWLGNKLLDLASKNPRGSSLIFWSLDRTPRTSPVSSSHIRESFYKYLYDVFDEENGYEIGVMIQDPKVPIEEGEKLIRKSELIRRERNIVFHSFRHYFATEAQALGADVNKLRLTVGHESQAMTDNYTHADYNMVKSIADISHTIIGEGEVIE